ncbi:MAG TPA: GNAT family N-acetyltransferase [Gaiellaceae bacterium]|nr:GNAT family N-acetyltransferase [Gaiellaceae bacterium]
MDGLTLRFRPLEPADLHLMHEWLQRPHVKRWWRDRETYEAVVEHYLPSIEGDEPTDHYLALLGEEPIGYVETYLVSDYPDYAALIGVAEGVAGVDLFIADEALTGQGLGTEILRRFVDEVVFGTPSTTSCVADPAARNVASRRAFEKAGFRVVKEFVEDGEPHALMRRDRSV